jgi:DNA-damage-inducible protein J
MYRMSTAMIHVRIDETTKAEATLALEAMGLSVSDAVRALLVRVAAEKEMPFALRVPNATTIEAILEAKAMTEARYADPAALWKALDAGKK